MSIENAKLLLSLAKLEADRQVERIASARSHFAPPAKVSAMEKELDDLRQSILAVAESLGKSMAEEQRKSLTVT